MLLIPLHLRIRFEVFLERCVCLVITFLIRKTDRHQPDMVINSGRGQLNRKYGLFDFATESLVSGLSPTASPRSFSTNRIIGCLLKRLTGGLFTDCDIIVNLWWCDYCESESFLTYYRAYYNLAARGYVCCSVNYIALHGCLFAVVANERSGRKQNEVEQNRFALQRI